MTSSARMNPSGSCDLPREQDFSGNAQMMSVDKASTSFGKQMYDEQWCRNRWIPSGNRVSILADRELGGVPYARRNKRHFREIRDFYPTIKLDRISVVSDQVFGDASLSWSPNGKYLVGVNTTSRCVDIYRYMGIGSGIGSSDSELVSKMLPLAAQVHIPSQMPGSEASGMLRSDFALFTDDSLHLIVISLHTAVSEQQGNIHEVFRSNEGMPLSTQALEHYAVHCIDLEKKTLADSTLIRTEKILMTNGVFMCQRHFGVLSIQHQTISIFTIQRESGKLVLVREIGPSVHEDDTLFLRENTAELHLRTTFMSGLKQRVATFLYERAKRDGKIPEFLRQSENRSSLKMYRAQIFDTYYLLIKMLPFVPDPESSRIDVQYQPCFFIVMDWRNCAILDVFEKFDARFLEFVDMCGEALIYPNVSESLYPISHQYHYHTREAYNRMKHRCEASPEMYRKMLYHLPYPTHQQYKISLQSPYMDPALFAFDERFHTFLLSGKVRSDSGHVRFASRRTGQRLFSVRVGTGGGRLPALFFHPTDPLVVVTERTSGRDMEGYAAFHLPSAEGANDESVDNILAEVNDSD